MKCFLLINELKKGSFNNYDNNLLVWYFGIWSNIECDNKLMMKMYVIKE